MQLALPSNSRCSQRTLQTWSGRYGAVSCSYSLCLARERIVVVPMFDRVHKDWFDFVFACKSWRLLCFQVWDFFFMSSRDFCFMGCLWGGPGSDFLVLLWSCPASSYAMIVPKTWWSLLLHKQLGIWVVYAFFQIGCVVMTVSTFSCWAGGTTSMLFTIS